MSNYRNLAIIQNKNNIHNILINIKNRFKGLSIPNKKDHSSLLFKKNVSLKEWNKFVINKYPRDTKLHIHCGGCDICSCENDKIYNSFKRCRKCKKAYFCSRDCKLFANHSESCDENKNIDLAKIVILGILVDKDKRIIYPNKFLLKK